MIGGNETAVARLDPIFKTLAPGMGTRRARREAVPGTAPPRRGTCTAVRQARGTL